MISTTKILPLGAAVLTWLDGVNLQPLPAVTPQIRCFSVLARAVQALQSPDPYTLLRAVVDQLRAQPPGLVDFQIKGTTVAQLRQPEVRLLHAAVILGWLDLTLACEDAVLELELDCTPGSLLKVLEIDTGLAA